MGFKPQRKLYRLTFEDPGMNGLQVMMRSVTMGKMLELQQLGDDAEKAKSSAAFAGIVNILADALETWNVEEEDGTPVPPDLDGVLSMDPDFIMEIISAWTQAVSGVSDPLAKGSTSGEAFQEALIPMEPLLSSLSN